VQVERGNPHQIADEFFERVRRFREEGAKIRNDSPPEFWNLVTRLASLRDSEVEEIDRVDEVGRDKLLSAIDEIMIFLEAK
jgi:hypothetical protein